MSQTQAPLNLSANLQKLNSGVVTVFTGKSSQVDLTKVTPIYSKGVLTSENLMNDPVLVGLSQQVATNLNNAKTLMNQLGYTDVTQAPAIRVNQASLKVTPGQLKMSKVSIGGTTLGSGTLAAKTPAVAAKAAPALAKSGIGVVEVGSGATEIGTIAGKTGGTVTKSPVGTQPVNTTGVISPGFTPISWLVNESVIIASSLDLTDTNLIIGPSVSQLTIIVETLTCGPGAQISYDDATVWNPSPLPKTTATAGNSYNQSNHPSGPNDGPSGGNGAAGQSPAAQTVVPPAAPNISIYALNITGMPAINIQGLKGAPGNPGQNGGNGGNGAKGVDGRTWLVACRQTPGNGGNGGNGGAGGNGGRGGQGGAGGSFFIATTQDNWQALLTQSWHVANTGGAGGDPGLPGNGGAGGAGGEPGNSALSCSNGRGGSNGTQGTSGSAGADGAPGNGGVITPAIITAAEWEEELTLPWLQTINPSQGPPGTPVTAVGLNVDAGDTVLVNGQSVTASSPNSGQLQFNLPAVMAGGTATIAIRRVSDGKTSNSMNFSVQPLITGSAPSGGYTPGDTVILSGAAFVANASIHFTPAGQAEQVIVPQKIGVDGTLIDFVVPGAATAASQGQGSASVMVVNPDGSQSNTLQLTSLSFVSNGFIPDTNGFSFINFKPGTPDWGTFSDDFGSFEVGLSAISLPVLTGAYFAAYYLYLSDLLTGLCTGFSLAAMNRFLNGETRAVDEPLTPALTREFTVDMGRLFSGQLLSSFLEQCLNGLAQAETTLQQIEQAFTNGATRGNMPILFFIPSGLPVSKKWFDDLNASHCIVPYKITRPAGWTSGYDGVQLYIYDCNNPSNNGCFLTFQQRGSQLAFSYNSDSSVSSDNGFTLGVLTMDQALYNGVDLPWVYAGEAALEFVVDLILSPATLAVSNLAGQTTGTRGDTIVAEVPGAVPSLQPMHDLVMLPRQMALQRTIQGTAAGTYTYVSIAPPDPNAAADEFNALVPQGQSARVVPNARSVTLQNVSCTPTTRDVVLVGPNNYSIQVSTNESGKTFDALLTQRYDVQTGAAPNVQTTSQLQHVAITGLNVAPGEQLLVWSDAVLGQVGVSNTGAAKNFKVSVSTIDPATGKVTASQNVDGAVGANADFAVAVTDWHQLAAAPATKQGALNELLPPNFQMPSVQ